MKKKSCIHHQQIFGNEKIMHVTKNSANEKIMCGRYHNLANDKKNHTFTNNCANKKKIMHSPTIWQMKIKNKKCIIDQQIFK
jgi:hypothetical protein